MMIQETIVHPTMMHHLISVVAQYSSVVGFLIGLPFMAGAYYESFKARQEARRAREGTLHSRDCLEFVAGDGNCINLVPLETLHSLPRAGDVILLPGDGMGVAGSFMAGAYLVESDRAYLYAARSKESPGAGGAADQGGGAGDFAESGADGVNGFAALAPDDASPCAPDSVVQQAGLLGLEGLVGALDVEVELRRPADRGAALGVVALGPLGEQRLVAHDVGDKVEQTLRHLLLDDQVGILDDDLFANVVQGHEDGRHPQHPLLQVLVADGMALGLALLLEQRAVGDVAGDGGHVERAVELVEALVDQAQPVGAAGHHAGAR